MMSNDDPYLKQIDEQWHNIVMVYETFKDLKPIIEYDITHEKIYSYPAEEYIQALSLRTRKQTKKLYKKAVRKNQFLLFIKDVKNQRLRSYIFDLPARN
jgi:hypothetical protein